ncbi:TPA: helix-turn-helix domain-containing protein [Klebsiella aerogenes]|nr:helix-turn-helix domain-containing protein [Klebsiella aerogenes]
MKTTYSDVIDQYNHVVASDLELIQPLISANQPRIIKDNGVFKIEPGEVIIVVEGIIAIEVEYNAGFGSASKRGARSKTLDMLQIGKGIRGMIFGIIESYGPALSLKYTAKKNVKIVTCSKEAFEHYFIQRDRFAYLMEIMAFQLSLIIDAHHEKNLPSRYDTIKSMICRYKKQQDAGVLHDRSLASFILKRTKMSRSYLFKILAELKEGGYIKMENGELIDIAHELPEKF